MNLIIQLHFQKNALPRYLELLVHKNLHNYHPVKKIVYLKSIVNKIQSFLAKKSAKIIISHKKLSAMQLSREMRKKLKSKKKKVH